MTDKRVAAIIVSAKAHNPANANEFAEAIVKETVKACMKQLAMPVNIKDPLINVMVHAQWDHLATRFSITEPVSKY